MPKEEFSDEFRHFVLNSEIENLITTSLIYEGKFIAAYHNKSNQQEIVISIDQSSKGYKKFNVKKGNYEFVLSMHSSNSPIDANFKVEALDE